MEIKERGNTLFVYGTLREDNGQSATLQGYKVDRSRKIFAYPYLTSDKNGEVDGQLIKNITPNTWKSLDYYEGYPSLYTIISIEVTLETGEKLKTVAYNVTDETRKRHFQKLPIR